MRYVFALGLLAAAPAFAQQGNLMQSKDQRDLAASTMAQAQLHAGDLWLSDSRRERANRYAPAMVKAGAWGRCVADAAPQASRAYVQGVAADPVLRPTFRRCFHEVGQFLLSNRGAIRRAALSDALASR